jgi:hypothetical protein
MSRTEGGPVVVLRNTWVGINARPWHLGGYLVLGLTAKWIVKLRWCIEYGHRLFHRGFQGSGRGSSGSWYCLISSMPTRCVSGGCWILLGGIGSCVEVVRRRCRRVWMLGSRRRRLRSIKWWVTMTGTWRRTVVSHVGSLGMVHWLTIVWVIWVWLLLLLHCGKDQELYVFPFGVANFLRRAPSKICCLVGGMGCISENYLL